jgi:formamidopyrimidine-DNA glycosylase
MPELPEVEVTCRGLRPLLTGRTVKAVTVRNRSLRVPVPEDIDGFAGGVISSVSRRAKYILLAIGGDTAVIHLGMTGHISVVDQSEPLKKHDHYDFILDNGKVMRYNDPRRFGGLWRISGDPFSCSPLAGLGAEPLTCDFTAEYLHSRLQRRHCPVKLSLMNNSIVVGVGNIYASEVLFASGIHPCRPSSDVSLDECEKLVAVIKCKLEESIKSGGTTIRNYSQVDGSRGEFADRLRVYGKPGCACPNCGSPVQTVTLGQRSTFYCSVCQK